MSNPLEQPSVSGGAPKGLDDIFAPGKLFDIRDVEGLLKRRQDEKSHTEIARRMIKEGVAFFIFEDMPHFTHLNHNTLVLLFLEEGQGQLLAPFLDRLEELTMESARRLINAGQKEAISLNLRSFTRAVRPEVEKLVS